MSEKNAFPDYELKISPDPRRMKMLCFFAFYYTPFIEIIMYKKIATFF